MTENVLTETIHRHLDSMQHEHPATVTMIRGAVNRLAQRLRDLEQERQAVESSGGYAVIDDLKKRLRDSEARVQELERMVDDSEAGLMEEATARRAAKEKENSAT